MSTRDSIDQLFEVHYQDLWPEAFSAMIKKYRSQGNRGSDLYVNFTSRPDAADPLARDAYTKPDHRDMIGTYAYPLWYVVKHPADLWYGFNAEFVRVLRDKSRNKLNLTTMDWADCAQVIRDAGFRSGDNQIRLAKKYFPDRAKGITAPGKILVTIFQADLEAGRGSYVDGKFVAGEKHGWTWEYKLRTGPEQTALFKKAGIDAVEDDATRISQAAINDREPRQICFLGRHAFEVVETVHLGKRGLYRTQRNVNTTHNFDHLKRKLAQQVAEVMGDKLLGKEGKRDTFYTVAGRAVQIDVDDTSTDKRMASLKMGQKLDRDVTTKTPHRVTVNVHTEFGEMRATAWSDDRVQSAVDDLAQQWSKLAKDVPKSDWRKRTAKSDEEDEQAKFKEQVAQKMRKEADEIADDTQVSLTRWNQFAKRLGTPTVDVPKDAYDRFLVTRRAADVAYNPDIKLAHFRADLRAEVSNMRDLVHKAEELGVDLDKVGVNSYGRMYGSTLAIDKFLDLLDAKLAENEGEKDDEAEGARDLTLTGGGEVNPGPGEEDAEGPKPDDVR